MATITGNNFASLVQFSNVYFLDDLPREPPQYRFFEGEDGTEVAYVLFNSQASQVPGIEEFPTIIVRGPSFQVDPGGLLTGRISELEFLALNNGVFESIALIEDLNLSAQAFTDLLLGRLTIDGTDSEDFDQLLANAARTLDFSGGANTVPLDGFLRLLREIDLGIGNDRAIVSSLSDFRARVDGGQGVDTLEIGSSGEVVSVDLSRGIVSSRNGQFSFTGFETIQGSARVTSYSGSEGGDRIIAGVGADTINGNGGNDTLIGGAGNDLINGGAGNDRLAGGRGVDTIDGGSGVDTAVIDFARRDLGVSQQGSDILISFGSTSSVYRNVENFEFADGTLSRTEVVSLPLTVDGTAASDLILVGVDAAVIRGLAGQDRLTGGRGDDTILGGFGFDTLAGGEGDDVLLADTFEVGAVAAISGQVFRMYQAALGRTPDEASHAIWTERLLLGEVDLAEIADRFVRSGEFEATYGALDDAAFVTLIYQNVLGRLPDPVGFAGWIDRLENGTERAEVVLRFAESLEFRDKSEALVDRFNEGKASADWLDDVYHLYVAALDRTPDAVGWAGWTSRLAQGEDLGTAAAQFIQSAEFQMRYGALESAAFISLLYQNALGRDADTIGLSTWLSRLDGGVSREDVILAFSQSSEFIAATDQAVLDYLETLNRGDTLMSDAGNDILVGGALVDEFVFDAAVEGATTVYGMQVWDTLMFSGFGSAFEDDPTAAFTEVGDDLVFNEDGVQVRIKDFTLAELAQVDFEFGALLA